MLKHVKVGKHILCMRWKLSKNILFVKFHPGMKCLHVFFFLVFSARDEISSRQKRVNSKRHFFIDRDDFILGWNFMCKHPFKIRNYVLHKNLCCIDKKIFHIKIMLLTSITRDTKNYVMVTRKLCQRQKKSHIDWIFLVFHRKEIYVDKKQFVLYVNICCID